MKSKYFKLTFAVDVVFVQSDDLRRTLTDKRGENAIVGLVMSNLYIYVNWLTDSKDFNYQFTHTNIKCRLSAAVTKSYLRHDD